MTGGAVLLTANKTRSALLIGLPLVPERTLRQSLIAEGIPRVLRAGDRAEAGAILSSELVDIVFAPESGEGYRFRDVLGMIGGRGPNSRTPVVLLDEGMARPDLVAAIKAGAAGVLSLPAPRDALRELLARLIGEGDTESGRRERGQSGRSSG